MIAGCNKNIVQIIDTIIVLLMFLNCLFHIKHKIIQIIDRIRISANGKSDIRNTFSISFEGVNKLKCIFSINQSNDKKVEEAEPMLFAGVNKSFTIFGN